jgi:hypothetical protein
MYSNIDCYQKYFDDIQKLWGTSVFEIIMVSHFIQIFCILPFQLFTILFIVIGNNLAMHYNIPQKRITRSNKLKLMENRISLTMWV